jgi:hypothetical protein
MKTLEESLPLGVIRPLAVVEAETGLSRSSILARGVSYRATNDAVVRGPIAHKGFTPPSTPTTEDKAHAIWEAHGKPEGEAAANWAEAETPAPTSELQSETPPGDPHPVD